MKAVPIHESVIARFNDDPYYRNQLAVTYLLINRYVMKLNSSHSKMFSPRHLFFLPLNDQN